MRLRRQYDSPIPGNSPILTKKEIDRFQSNIDVKTKIKCWNWLRACNSRSGQGVVTIKSKQYQARRISYQLWVDLLPETKDVKQTCENPKCVNPYHLELTKKHHGSKLYKGYTKWCPSCDEYKDTEEFSLDLSKSDGLRVYCRPCNTQNVQNYQRDNLKYFLSRRDNHLRRFFNITLNDFNDLYLKQDGKCAICKGSEKDGVSLCVDHDRSCCEGPRSCGKCVRGLLCGRCNTTLGKFEDKIEWFENAIIYLSSERTNPHVNKRSVHEGEYNDNYI